MFKTSRRSVAALVFALAAAGCGSDAATDDVETTEAAQEVATTAAETTTTEAPTTTAAETTTTEQATTTTTEPAPVLPDPPPAGTGILTIGDEELPFTIETCVTEPQLSADGSSALLFEIRGALQVEGENAEARLLRIAVPPDSPGNDSYGWGYATDPNDFETLVSVSSEFGIGRVVIVEETDEGLTFYGPPTPFERTEGISVVDDVDPGMGSIIATCTV